jgi:hypothetical protein
VSDEQGAGGGENLSELVALPLEEARLLAGRLESEGIRAVVPGDDEIPLWGASGTMPGLQQTEWVVLVETDKLEQARQIVDEIRGS